MLTNKLCQTTKVDSLAYGTSQNNEHNVHESTMVSEPQFRKKSCPGIFVRSQSMHLFVHTFMISLLRHFPFRLQIRNFGTPGYHMPHVDYPEVSNLNTKIL